MSDYSLEELMERLSRAIETANNESIRHIFELLKAEMERQGVINELDNAHRAARLREVQGS